MIVRAKAMAVSVSLCILAGCKLPANKPVPDLSGDRPPDLDKFAFVESFRGTPTAIGCADGQREGFADLRKFPNIAGCLGTWQGRKNLTDPRTGRDCGDDLGACASPADICAAGWSICARTGNPEDLRTRISADACHEGAGPGRFVAAMSHGQVQKICPPRPTPDSRFPCFDRGVCAEPVCCGDACSFGACKDAVWPGETKITRGVANGCGAAESETHGGVMCCRDEVIEAIAAKDVEGDIDLGVPTLPKPEVDAASNTEADGSEIQKKTDAGRSPSPEPDANADGDERAPDAKRPDPDASERSEHLR